MGNPRRNRKKYDKPKDMWNLARIGADNALIEEYGLKNMRELWKVQTEISALRRNVRSLLSGTSAHGSAVQERMLGRLSRYGMTSRQSTLDNLLDLTEKAFLARRLQSIVFKKGLTKSIKQARQLIVHGYISINGRRVNRPGYLVSVDEEPHIGYYKRIDLEGVKKNAEEKVSETSEEAAAKAAEVKAE